jgi:DTW domain-containing protein YfiP
MAVGRSVVIPALSRLSSTLRSKHATTIGVMDDVDRTLRNIQQEFSNDIDLKSLPPEQRQPVMIARNLSKRLPHLGCRRCWLWSKFCICDQLKPVDETVALPFFEKIFVLMHHKEVGLELDTAKIIFAAFPETSRLVIGGIPSKYQASMKEMEDAISNETCVVLFPKVGAPLTTELFRNHHPTTTPNVSKFSSVIVIDGTWEQARRLHCRYIPDTIQNVQLDLDNRLDDEGRQLRHHPIPVREIATCHALQLLAEDLGISSLPLREYQTLSKAAILAHRAACHSVAKK